MCKKKLLSFVSCCCLNKAIITDLSLQLHFRQNINFSQKLGSATFICLLNPNSMQTMRKKSSNVPILRKWCYRQMDRRTGSNSQDP